MKTTTKPTGTKRHCPATHGARPNPDDSHTTARPLPPDCPLSAMPLRHHAWLLALLLLLGCNGHAPQQQSADSATATPVSPSEWVDLGLPSGLLWATCNLGATRPEESGAHYAWGETTPKSTYTWKAYRHADGDSAQLTRYCNQTTWGCKGFTDQTTVLHPSDDAATQALGAGIRMPTQAEWEELIGHTTAEWTAVGGVEGYRLTAHNGNSLFLPAAGGRHDGNLIDAGTMGCYWSASLCEEKPTDAWHLDFYEHYLRMDHYERYYGGTVRPVRTAQ